MQLSSGNCMTLSLVVTSNLQTLCLMYANVNLCTFADAVPLSGTAREGKRPRAARPPPRSLPEFRPLRSPRPPPPLRPRPRPAARCVGSRARTGSCCRCRRRTWNGGSRSGAGTTATRRRAGGKKGKKEGGELLFATCEGLFLNILLPFSSALYIYKP